MTAFRNIPELPEVAESTRWTSVYIAPPPDGSTNDGLFAPYPSGLGEDAVACHVVSAGLQRRYQGDVLSHRLIACCSLN